MTATPDRLEQSSDDPRSPETPDAATEVETSFEGDPLERLIDIEAIKQLKARYFRLIDTQKWDELEQVFIEDASFSFPGDRLGAREGRRSLIDYARASLEGGRSVHHGHMGEIELTSATTARGIWAMSDFCEFRTKDGTRRILSGSGHYHEGYVKQDGHWRIASMRLERLRVDITTTNSDHFT
jgi:hypothetical protein